MNNLTKSFLKLIDYLYILLTIHAKLMIHKKLYILLIHKKLWMNSDLGIDSPNWSQVGKEGACLMLNKFSGRGGAAHIDSTRPMKHGMFPVGHYKMLSHDKKKHWVELW